MMEFLRRKEYLVGPTSSYCASQILRGFVFFVCFFFNLKTFYQQKDDNHFIAILTSMQWSGTKPAIFLRYTCTFKTKARVVRLEKWLLD